MVSEPSPKCLVRGGREHPTAAAPAGDLPWLGRFMKNQGLDAARGVFSSLPSLSPQQARVLLTLEYERMEHRPVVHVLHHGGRVALHVGADHRTNAFARKVVPRPQWATKSTPDVPVLGSVFQRRREDP